MRTADAECCKSPGITIRDSPSRHRVPVAPEAAILRQCAAPMPHKHPQRTSTSHADNIMHQWTESTPPHGAQSGTRPLSARAGKQLGMLHDPDHSQALDLGLRLRAPVALQPVATGRPWIQHGGLYNKAQSNFANPLAKAHRTQPRQSRAALSAPGAPNPRKLAATAAVPKTASKKQQHRHERATHGLRRLGKACETQCMSVDVMQRVATLCTDRWTRGTKLGWKQATTQITLKPDLPCAVEPCQVPDTSEHIVPTSSQARHRTPALARRRSMRKNPES